MPKHVGNIGSTESASNTSKDNWQSVGKLAARLVGRNACYKGETAQAIAERKVGEVMHALDNDDFLAAKMATESLGKFLAEYAEARQ